MKRVYVAYVVLAVVLASFFHLRLTGNPMSRLFTVFALVEHGNLEADAWASETEDKAVINGHTYSDKAPLSSFVVVPFYAVWKAVVGGPHTGKDHEAGLHLGIILTAALPFALFLALVLWRLLKDGMQGAVAVPFSLLLGFGTVLFNYGNAYFGHMLAAGCFMGAWVLSVEHERHLAVAGFLAACAVLAEYPTGALAVLLVGWHLFQPGGVKRAATFVAGAVPGALALGLYNWVVTGNPLTLTYSHVTAQWQPMKTNYGMRLPDPVAAWELIFGQFRGMFFYAPIMLVLVPAWMMSHPNQRRRRFGLTLFAIYWMMMAAYFKWDGGFCTGPRHLLPVVALAIYEGVVALKGRLPAPKSMLGLALLGMLINLSAAATDPIVYDGEPRPFFNSFWPKLIKGEINAHNLGVEMGLPNGRYLVGVWVLLFAVVAVLLAVLFQRAAPVMTMLPEVQNAPVRDPVAADANVAAAAVAPPEVPAGETLLPPEDNQPS